MVKTTKLFTRQIYWNVKTTVPTDPSQLRNCESKGLQRLSLSLSLTVEQDKEQTSTLSSSVVAVDWSVLQNWKGTIFLVFFPKLNFFPVEPKFVTTCILIYLMNVCENFWMTDDGFVEIMLVYLINLLGFPYFVVLSETFSC